MNSSKLTRRSLLCGASAMACGALAGKTTAQETSTDVKRMVKNGRILQSASRWCYGKLTLDQLCEAGAKIGLVGIDLLGPKDFPTLKKHGLVCTMSSGVSKPQARCSATSRAQPLTVAMASGPSSRNAATILSADSIEGVWDKLSPRRCGR